MSNSVVGIMGLGTSLPDYSATQGQFASFICRTLALSTDDARFVRLITARSGIERRHAVILDENTPTDDALPQRFYGTTHSHKVPSTSQRMNAYARYAPALAEQAARQALDDAPSGYHDPRAITHLVTFSCTGFNSPGVDIELIHRLELRADVERVHIGFMGCHAAINALRVARAFVTSNPEARALVVGVELSSLHMIRTSRRDQLVAACLFGDGATAALLTGSSDAKLKLIDTASVLLPESGHMMGWSIGDHGFEMSLSEEVPSLIANHTRAWMETLADRLGLQADELRDRGMWSIHPGGPRVLDSVAKALELPPEALDASRDVLRRFGNMSSVTTLFILDRLRRQPSYDGPPIPLVAMAFGPGLCGEAALFELG